MPEATRSWKQRLRVDPFRVGTIHGALGAVRGARGTKAWPCPRLFNFHPLGVATPTGQKESKENGVIPLRKTREAMATAIL